jgi:shikimate kinase
MTAAAIVLTGLSGSGKSSVGTALSQTLSWNFVDLDVLIEAEAGCSIGELFSSKGEPYFRELETLILEKLVSESETDGTRKVISTGGGTPISQHNRKLLKKLGPVIFLTAPVKVLAARLSGDQNRPLLNANDNQLNNVEEEERISLLATRLENLLNERRDAYLEAEHVVDTSISDAPNIAAEICRLLKID